MHVDGGVVSQVFLWGFGVTISDVSRRAGLGGPPVPVNLWVIRNGRVYPERLEMEGELLSITGRALSTMIKSQGQSDLGRLAVIAEANGMQFHLASIPPEFTGTSEELFEPEYMRALFDFGFQQAVGGSPWSDSPPLHNQLLGR